MKWATARPAASVLVLLAGVTACASNTAGGGPVLTVAGSAAGRFDSNVRRAPEADPAYGGGGEVLLRAANGVQAPTLQLEYAAGVRHSAPEDPSDGTGHRLNALAGVPVSQWLRLDALFRASHGGVDEDLSPTDEITAVGRLELQVTGATRVRGYAAHRWREVPAATEPALGRYGGVQLRQRFGRSTTLLVDGRYEDYRPPDATRSWERAGLTLGVGQTVFRNTALELEVRGRERTYPGRTLQLGDDVATRRDEDLRYGLALVYDNGGGTELRLEVERDRRHSNDVLRGYSADRVSLVLRRRAFALGGRREPPHIDERAGSDAIRATFPEAAPLSARTLNGVVVAGTGVCAVAEAGALCWPALADGSRPVVLQGRWRRVSAATGRACGLDDSGTVYCWGWSRDARQSGSAAFTPPVALRSEARFVDLAVGPFHACALTAEGTAFCWGDNGDGQLGNGLAIPAPAPVAVLGDARFRAISAGERHTCALDHAGAVHCWGANESGQAGAGALRRTLRPKLVEGGRTFSALSAGTRHTCALTEDGRAWCWGENGRGQAGVAGGGVIVDGGVPVSSDARFVAIAAGWAHTCALDETGRAWCWGANRHGQLGTSGTDEEPHPRPVPVAGERQFASLSASFRTCALDDQQNVFCWGGSGQHPAADLAAARPRRLSTRLR
jgi:alpha-tubulin suppressor-like RCC1 family protein